MENLFSTNISVNNKNIVYNVIFENEKYVFISETNDPELPLFSVSREHDEWHWHEIMPAEVTKQATEALEKFLLAQH